jgi:demethylmenaquinone methyltransferase/2-methoxy-6-polyprenyl-1,4-benzoquinol methylase
MVSNNRPAYEYLPSTVAEFPDGEEFCSILRSVGFSKAVCYPQTFGIASIYIATKEQ